MSSNPRQTLIAALEGVVKGRIPDTHNLLRMIHHGYVETREIVTRNANAKVCVREYYLHTTSAGEALLEAME